MTVESKLVLRFSNPDGVDTVTAHREIVETQESCWWGWWRKENIESPGLIELARYSGRSMPITVGLVNRTEGQYWTAEVTEIRFDASGARAPSPDPTRTPSYYDDRTCGAWLRMTNLSRLDEASWSYQFGSVPQGDHTLYESRVVEGSRELLPKQHWQLSATEAPGRHILHISDLHFGDHHAYAQRRVADAASAADSRLVDCLLDAIEGLQAQIGIVVVSGDTITKGDADAFGPATAFLEELARRLGLDHEHFVIVPGNHDFLQLSGDDLASVDFHHEYGFRAFMDGFYGQSKLPLERVQRFRLCDWDLVFVALNSARLRGPDSKEYGFVGRDRYLKMLKHVADTLAGLPESRRLLFGVLHHQLLPVPRKSLPSGSGKVSLTLDAANLLSDFEAHGVDIVLHGHQHLPFVSRSKRWRQRADVWDFDHLSDVHVIGMGSTGASGIHLGDELRDNTFGLYEPTDSGLRLRTVAFNPTREARVVFDEILDGTGTA